jgi:hypothetical protein
MLTRAGIAFAEHKISEVAWPLSNQADESRFASSSEAVGILQH